MKTIIGIYSIPDISDDKFPRLIHDHNLCVYKENAGIDYLHQERISRNKYDACLQNNLAKILSQLNLLGTKDTTFVFTDHEIGRSVLSANGKIRFEAPMNDSLHTGLERGRLFLFDRWIDDAFVLNHELAHIFSAIPFYGMFKENSLLVHFDGGASKSNFSAWHYINGTIKLIKANYELKWLSSLFNANALVFSMVEADIRHQNAVPGKFMGLEAFGTYKPEIERWLVDNNYFQDCWQSKNEFYRSANANFDISIGNIDNKNNFIQDIAATMHEIFLRESLKVFEQLQNDTNTTDLYYTGGTALNIKLNARIINSGLFNTVYIPPCTNDAGLSLGAMCAGALYKNVPLPTQSPYLNNYNISHNTFETNKINLKKCAEYIANGKVIGICNGYAEAGPRALGNRSIVARADKASLAQKISVDIKKREWYRPIAPVMLHHNFCFFTGMDKAPAVAQYMLTEFDILPDVQKHLAGCTHVDGTSRIQVLPNREFNPFLFDLLKILDADYGIKALINTSFNQQGEPIVHTHNDAKESAKRMNLDAIVLNGEIEEL